MPEKKEFYFKSHDHHRLYSESYHPKKPKAVLIFIEGLNEHVGRYQNTTNYFSDDFTLYYYDHRGHGHSDGVRSHVEHFHNYVLDLEEFVSLVQRQEKDQPIFMVGHSMGGQILLNYLGLSQHVKLSGFITSSPNIRARVSFLAIKKLIGEQIVHFAPKLKLRNSFDSKWLSRDKNVGEVYKKDPLVAQYITASLAREIMANQETIIDLATNITLPALMLHGGEDHICDPKGSEDFFENLGSQDKELKIYKGFYHEIFNEIGKEEVFEDMSRWLLQRC